VLNVAVPPSHIVASATVGAGRLFTLTVALVVAVQPLLSVTVTLYTVVAFGDTLILCVVAPVDQLYEA
jgi:hypothetical protein